MKAYVSSSHVDDGRKTFAAGVTLFGIMLFAFLLIFAPAKLVIGIPLAIGVLTLAWKYPRHTAALVLLLIPFQPLPTMAAIAWEIRYATVFSSLKEFSLIFCIASVLYSQRRIRFHPSDWIIFAILAIASLQALVHGNILALRDDFLFVIPYAVGRVMPISEESEPKWVKAILIVLTVVALIGVAEYIAGPMPRVFLLGFTDAKELAASFRASGFAGHRIGSTLTGPLELGAMCAVGVLAFIAYRRRGISWKYAALCIPVILAALAMTLSRTSLVCVALGSAAIAFRRRQLRSFVIVAALLVALVLAAVPILGLSEFALETRSGSDSSLQEHSETILMGFNYMLTHPLGVGPGMAGPKALQESSKAMSIEDGFLVIAVQYSIVVGLLFVALCTWLFAIAWRDRSMFGDLAVALLIAYLFNVLVLPAHMWFAFAAWIWPVMGIIVGRYCKSDTQTYRLSTRFLANN